MNEYRDLILFNMLTWYFDWSATQLALDPVTGDPAIDWVARFLFLKF